MVLRRYKVTVMDNWTPMGMFWTMRSALAFLDKHPKSGNLYVWNNKEWQLCRLFANGRAN